MRRSAPALIRAAGKPVHVQFDIGVEDQPRAIDQ
jgi:hypothetical protein